MRFRGDSSSLTPDDPGEQPLPKHADREIAGQSFLFANPPGDLADMLLERAAVHSCNHAALADLEKMREYVEEDRVNSWSKAQ